METSFSPVKSILTRAGGYLQTVCSHSLQPYRGCPFGRSLCGAGCYVRHSGHLLKGREWGAFLEVRTNAGEVYREQYERERKWAHGARGRFSVFLSSATEPFPPQERRYGVTRGVLEAMSEAPPDELIVQTHSHRVGEEVERLANSINCVICGFICRLRRIGRGCRGWLGMRVRWRSGSRRRRGFGGRGCSW